MQTKLPKSLNDEPLVDVVFEVRLIDPSQLADILPGFLLDKLKTKPKITRLPAADLPLPVRVSDPGLQFAPIQRLELEKYFISIGDQNIVISCKLPYQKWPNFKTEILHIINLIETASIEGQVDRYSIKYVNLIQAPTIAEQVKKIRMDITLGDIHVDDGHMSIQVHHKEDDILHIMSVITGARGKIPDGGIMDGVIVDIDSIRIINATDFTSFATNLEQGMEELRQANKKIFFECLTDDTIEKMGPIYE